MSDRLGLEAKLYRNTATWATPTWVEIENVRDLTQNLEKGEADMTTRGGAGFRQRRGTLKDGSIEFQMLFDPTDTDFTAVKDAFFNNTTIELAAMSADITTTGEQGLRALMDVINFSRSEALEEGQLMNVRVAIAPSPDAPVWYIVP